MSEKIACGSCGRKGSKHLCPYCRCASYCNEQCAMVGWNAHQDECNVIHVSSPTATAFVPYFGEDQFDERQLEEVDPNGGLHQTYIVHYTDPAGAIVQHTIEPILGKASFIEGGSKLGDGANPADVQWGPNFTDKGISDRKYSMVITYRGAGGFGPSKKTKIDGLTFGSTAIHRDAKNTLGKLAKLNPTRFYNTDKSTLVLWPESRFVMNAMAKAGIEIDSQGGSMYIELYMDGYSAPFSSIYGALEFGKRRSGIFQVFKRGFKSLLPFQKEFEVKMGGKKQSSLETLVMLRGADNQGNAVQLTFQMNRDKQGVPIGYAELVDVEYSVPVRLIRFGVTAQESEKTKPGSAGAYRNLTGDNSPSPDSSDDEAPPPPPSDNIPAQVHNSIPFRLDADNLDHVSGLLMAMEQQMDERYIEELNMIQQHQQKLEHSKLTGEEYSTPPAVQAVVHDMSNQMFKQIGLRWKAAFDTNYYKMHKNDPIDSIQDEVDTLKLPNPDDNKAKFKSWVMGKKGKSMGRIRAIQKIVTERMAAINDRSNKDYIELRAMSKQLAGVLNQ